MDLAFRLRREPLIPTTGTGLDIFNENSASSSGVGSSASSNSSGSGGTVAIGPVSSNLTGKSYEVSNPGPPLPPRKPSPGRSTTNAKAEAASPQPSVRY